MNIQDDFNFSDSESDIEFDTDSSSEKEENLQKNFVCSTQDIKVSLNKNLFESKNFDLSEILKSPKFVNKNMTLRNKYKNTYFYHKINLANPKSKSKIIEFQERFNPDKLSYLIENSYELGLLDGSSSLIDYKELLEPLNEYLTNSRHGIAHVRYRQNNGNGRFYAIGYSSNLQRMKRVIRHTISDEFYCDLDMVNAAPTILSWLCKMNDIDCSNLDKYIENREQLISDLGVERDVGKKIYISIINGGNSDYNSVKNKTKHLVRFKTEMKQIRKSCVELFSKKFRNFKKTEKDPKNIQGKFLSSLVLDIENEILMHIFDFFDKPKDCVLCFDGIMLRKTPSEEKIKNCEERINLIMGIDIRLKLKPFDEALFLPGNIPKI